MDRLKKLIRKSLTSALPALLLGACTSTPKYNKTVEAIDLDRFMGKWFVIASRATFLEEGAHNAIEEYQIAKKDPEGLHEIAISFNFNEDRFDGDVESIPQKGWIYNPKTNAHWKVSPFWPLKFDYLIIGIADDYSWTAVGVPNQAYLWIMARTLDMTDDELQKILKDLEATGYDIKDVKRIPHQKAP